MDVRCDHCQTEYEFDDAKVTEAGVTVKCTVCNHVFKVRKKAMAVNEPVQFAELESPTRVGTSGEKPREREWKVRQANGNLFSFKELTTLQKWIVERKVSRDDEISLTGEAWKRLGNIAELASFFQVVEAADRATVMAAQQPPPMYQPQPQPQMQMMAPQPQMVAPPQAYQSYPGYPMPQPPMPAPQPMPMQVQMVQPVQQPPPQVVAVVQVPSQPPAPAPVAPAPAPVAAVSNEPDDLELAAIRRGGSAKYIVGAIVFGVLVGAALFFKASTGSFNPFAKPPPPPAPVVQPEPTKPPEVPVVAEPAKPAEPKPAEPAKPDDKASPKPDDKAPAKPDDKVAAKPDEKAPAKPDDKAPAKPADKATPPKPADGTTPAKPADGTAVAAATPAGTPAGKNFDWYIQNAYRLRERNQAAAAMGYYDKAAELQPDSVEPIAGKAYCLVDLERLDEGIALFQQALGRHPRYLDAIMGLAEAYKQKGNNAKAVEFYQRYLDEAPGGPEAEIARNAIQRLKE